jgi:hypothetical protein
MPIFSISKAKRVTPTLGRVEPEMGSIRVSGVSKGQDMLWNLDPAWLMMAVALVAVLSFFFGSIMDAIMCDDGFGPVGNMAVIAIGFFAAIFLVNCNGIALHSLAIAVATGLSGAFLILAALAVLKSGLARF